MPFVLYYIFAGSEASSFRLQIVVRNIFYTCQGSVRSDYLKRRENISIKWNSTEGIVFDELLLVLIFSRRRSRKL
jgi:hypothetical protein